MILRAYKETHSGGVGLRISVCRTAWWGARMGHSATYKKSTFFNMVDPPKKMIFFFQEPQKMEANGLFIH